MPEKKLCVGSIDTLDVRGKTACENVKIFAGRINSILYNEGTSWDTVFIHAGSIGTRVEVPEYYQLIPQQLTINREVLLGIATKQYLCIRGPLLVTTDVRKEDLDSLVALMVYGKNYMARENIFCPDHLVGPLLQRITQGMGRIRPYDREAIVISRNLKIDSAFLRTLDDGTVLFIMGNVYLTDSLIPPLLKEKISRLDYTGKMVIKEECLNVLQPALNPALELEVIPCNHRYVDGDLELDAQLLANIKDNSLFITGDLMIREEITPALLEKLKSLHIKGHIICQESLKPVILALACRLDLQVLTYQGNLKLVDGDYRLTQVELEYLPANMTLIVRGILSIDNDIPLQSLQAKIDCIDNLGEINASKKHLGLIRSLLRVNSGTLTSEKDGSDEETSAASLVIGNLNYFKL